MVTIRSYSLLMIHHRIELFSCFPGINFGRQFVNVLGAVFRNSRFCRLRQDISKKNPFVLVRCLREVLFSGAFFFSVFLFLDWSSTMDWSYEKDRLLSDLNFSPSLLVGKTQSLLINSTWKTVLAVNFHGNSTPKTTHTCQFRWYFPMFSRYFNQAFFMKQIGSRISWQFCMMKTWTYRRRIVTFN